MVTTNEVFKRCIKFRIDTIPNNKVLEDKYHLFYIAKSYYDTLRR